MSPYEQRVREFAYQIWEAEGRPLGHEYRHWEMACKLVEEYEARAGATINTARQNPAQLPAGPKRNSGKKSASA